MVSRALSCSILCLSSLVALDAQEQGQVIPLWDDGAPGFEERRNEPEVAAHG